MNTNPVSVPLSTGECVLSQDQQTNLQALFRAAFSRFAQALNRWFLPHLLAGIGVFLLVAYVTGATLFAAWSFPFKWVGIITVLSIYGAVAFGYCFMTSCVLALRLACVEWNDLIEDILGLVQNRAASQLTDMNMGLSKPQATYVVRGSVRDVFAVAKEQQNGTWRWLAVLCLGMLGTVMRVVLSAKILKWSGRTVKLSKLFAGRATLVGAVFLNLHLLATLLLCLCYAFAGAVVLVNIYFVFLLK